MFTPQALDSVMNAECAVRSVGFFGPEGEGVYCCTNTETLSLWHAAGAQRIKDFGDLRALARGEPQVGSDGGDAAGAEEGGGASGPAAAAGKEWGVGVDCIVGCQVWYRTCCLSTSPAAYYDVRQRVLFLGVGRNSRRTSVRSKIWSPGMPSTTPFVAGFGHVRHKGGGFQRE